jgi:hypothetical protein
MSQASMGNGQMKMSENGSASQRNSRLQRGLDGALGAIQSAEPGRG